jgi:hypothetical protein
LLSLSTFLRAMGAYGRLNISRRLDSFFIFQTVEDFVMRFSLFWRG